MWDIIIYLKGQFMGETHDTIGHVIRLEGKHMQIITQSGMRPM